jgi:hypothetical protein
MALLLPQWFGALSVLAEGSEGIFGGELSAGSEGPADGRLQDHVRNQSDTPRGAGGLSGVLPSATIGKLKSRFSFETIGYKTVVSGTLALGGLTVIKTAGTSSGVTQGWGQLDFLGTTDSVGGYAVFSNGNGNEAAVPFELTVGETSPR